MSRSLDDPAGGEPDESEDLDDPRLAALVEALARGETVDWRQAEFSAGSEAEREQVRALAAISEVATFHRTWLAEGGITGNLDEDEEPDDEIPTHWGELEIIERVGRGSFGDVYKAREPRLDRIVALKLIRASAKTPEREAETLREGRLLAKVRHPNVATVHGAAGADGRVGFWMEFLEGKNLAEILQEKGLFDPREAAEIGIALCRALAAVHAQGIVHRDVKAQNVVRENDGRIVLTDFGVGRDATVLHTEEPSLSGTPLYLAPELFEGKLPSPASDLYALGVLLFHLVTGEFPITGNSFDELKAAHQGRKRRWLKELRKDLPGSFVAALERVLDRDLEKRGDEAGMEKELRRFLGERPLRRKRMRQAFIVAGAVFIFAVGMYVARELRRREALEHLDKAAVLHKEGHLQAAINELNEAKKIDPKNATVYLKLISYQSGLGRYSAALTIAKEADSLCGEFSLPSCLEVKGRLAIQLMDYKGALDNFEKVEKLGKDERILQEIVGLYRNLAQPDQGLPAARELGNIDDPVGAGELALTLSAAGRYPDAKVEVGKFRRRFPAHKYLPWVAGPVAIAAGDEATGENEFRSLATQHNDSEDESNGQLLWAQALMFRFKVDEAKEVLVKSSSLDFQEGFDRNEAIRKILFAKCFAIAGDFRQASLALQPILEQEKIPTNLKLFRNAALIAYSVNDIPLAVRFSKIVSQLAGKYTTSLSRSFDLQLKGELAWRRGNFEEAIKVITEARKERDDPQNSLSLARVYLGQKRCDLALPYLNDVVSRRGLIVDDFYTPWTIWNEAVASEASCRKK
ncbi:MAG: protein kinase [Acidobacteriota bacterium]